MCEHCNQSGMIDGYIAYFAPCPNKDCPETERRRLENDKALESLINNLSNREEQLA